ncbi:MAG TPA: hypothetical protein VGP22_18340 [Albitalea sp.]|jgi:hypothetical protein|nr:hypothetical protein [Albitalea sp.]
MSRLLLIGAALALVGGLAACGERVQTANPRKSDTAAWQGADNPYGAAGWKAGDKASWDEQMRTRALTQNEYAKTK